MTLLKGVFRQNVVNNLFNAAYIISKHTDIIIINVIKGPTFKVIFWLRNMIYNDI